jgi:hypothetical protein
MVFISNRKLVQSYFSFGLIDYNQLSCNELTTSLKQ